VHTAARVPSDVFVEGDAARLVRRPSEGNVEPPPPGLPGYEGTGVPIPRTVDACGLCRLAVVDGGRRRDRQHIGGQAVALSQIKM
jgi:hypothetical protein